MGGGPIGLAGDNDRQFCRGIDAGRSVCEHAIGGGISQGGSGNGDTGGVFDRMVGMGGGSFADGNWDYRTTVYINTVVLEFSTASVGGVDSDGAVS